MNPEPAPRTILRLENVSIRFSSGRTLFEGVNFNVREGEFVLLVGPSGSGKTTLLKLLADIADPQSERPEVSGRMDVVVAPAHGPGGGVGIVFQNLALFDELSAEENVRFAMDHREWETLRESRTARDWLERLHVPANVPMSRLSGGERQRVALARTLARDARLILFDEPTTGLDPARARAVVGLVHEALRAWGRTIIVVTHDFGPFLELNPRIILVDPVQRTLREVTPDELRSAFNEADIATPAAPPIQRTGAAAPRFWSWLDAPGQVLVALAIGLAAMFQGWAQPFWKWRYLQHYAAMVLVGPTAVYVALAGVMLGFVSITFTFRQLPYGQVTRPLLTEEFLAAAGYSSFRVVVPLLVGLLMAGKCAAAVAADLGARRLTHQFEAMRSLGARPTDYLLGNVVLALTLAGPLLTAIAFLFSTGASFVAFLLSVDEGTASAFRRNYFATVWPITRTLPAATGWVVLKSAATGYCVAGLSWLIGARPKESSVDVGRDVGRAIFWSSLAVLLLHSIFAFVEF